MSNYESTFMEYNPEMEAMQSEQFEWGGETEWSGETGWGHENEWSGESEWGNESEWSAETGWGGEAEWSGEMEVFSEAELMELAGELLEVTNEAELDRFLGGLIKKAGRALGQVVRSPIGQAVGGFLKGAAKRALPLAGAALGGYFGGPLGAKIGSGLASAAGGALGLEAEMNAEEREFEGAKNFVRMSGKAVKDALSAPVTANPVAVAQSVVTKAAQKNAPGLVGAAMGPAPRRGPGGRWLRRGRNIVIVNC